MTDLRLTLEQAADEIEALRVQVAALQSVLNALQRDKWIEATRWRKSCRIIEQCGYTVDEIDAMPEPEENQ